MAEKLTKSAVEKVKKLSIELEELQADYKKGLTDAGSDFVCDYENAAYSNDYICDSFHEFADGRIDIYYYDLFEWCKNNFEFVNQAQNEFGASGDIIQDIRAGQFLQIEQDLYHDCDDIIRLIALDYLQNISGVIIEKNLAFNWDEIDRELNRIDSNSTFDEIKDACDECLGVAENE